MTTNQTRRVFLGASLPLSVSALSAARVSGANDRIRIGVVGTGGRGQYLMGSLLKLAPDQVAFPAVCDIYDVRRAQAAEARNSMSTTVNWWSARIWTR
jgi:hypothetical protein